MSPLVPPANSIVIALRRHFTPLLLSSGIAILGYVAFQYGAMFFEQRRLEARWLEQQRILRPDDSRSRIALHSSGLTRISIPSIQFAAVIVEGTDESSLLIGPGHLTGTAEPGEPGNAVVSGHRDTFFRKIMNLAPGDPILIERGGRIFTYAVDGIRIVKPNDRSVAAPSGDNRLTLITCDPPYYPGSAPQRLVVVSKLVMPTTPAPSLAALKHPMRRTAMKKARLSEPER